MTAFFIVVDVLFFKRVGTLQLLGNGAMVYHAMLWCGESVFDFYSESVECLPVYT